MATVVVSRVSDLPCHNGRVVDRMDGTLQVATPTGKQLIEEGGFYWIPAVGPAVRIADAGFPRRRDWEVRALLERAGVEPSDKVWEANFRAADLASTCAHSIPFGITPDPAPRDTSRESP